MAKRANLEGKKRDDGRWEIRVTATTITGGKTRKSLYGQTKKEAQDKAQKFIYEHSRQANTSVRYQQLIDAYDDSLEGRPKDTARSYRNSLKHIRTFWSTEQVDTIGLPEIMGKLTKLTGSMHDHVRTVLSQMLNYGKMHGLNTQNPLAGVKVSRKAKNEHAECSYEQLAEKLPYLFVDIHPFLFFLAHTGLRPWKEAINIDKSQIGRFADETYVQVLDSKTEAGEGRLVPITDRSLLDYLDTIDQGRIFPNLTTRGVQQSWKRASKYVENGATIYGLRSTAITAWCEAEESLEVVMSRAGHADVKTTLNIYNRVRKARALLGRGVNNGVKMSDFTSQSAKK